MTNSLRLADLDDVELLMAVELAFGVQITNSEAEKCLAVGDLYNVLLKKFPEVGESSGRCLSTITYYRLKRAISSDLAARKPSPETPLSVLGGWLRRPARWCEIEAHTGLRLPELELGLIPAALTLAMFFSPILASIFVDGWTAAGFLLLTALSIPFASLCARQLPRECLTLGQLAKVTSAKNYGTLAHEYQSHSEKAVWDTLVTIIRDFTGIDEPIDKNTRFV